MEKWISDNEIIAWRWTRKQENVFLDVFLDLTAAAFASCIQFVTFLFVFTPEKDDMMNFSRWSLQQNHLF